MAKVELELGGRDRLDSVAAAALDLLSQHPPGGQRVRPAVLVEHFGEDDGVPGTVGEDPPGGEVGHQPAIEIAGVHVDVGVVGQVVLRIHHEDGICDGHARLGDGGEEALDGHPLPSEMALSVGGGYLHGVHHGRGAPLLESSGRFNVGHRCS